MGQQQLIFLLIAMVVVALAISAGLRMFDEESTKAEHRAAVQGATRLVGEIRAWKLKPMAVGGGRTSTGFSGLTFEALGYEVPASGALQVADTGCYLLEGSSSAAIISAYQGSKGSRCDKATHVGEVTITGTGPKDVWWAFN